MSEPTDLRLCHIVFVLSVRFFFWDWTVFPEKINVFTNRIYIETCNPGVDTGTHNYLVFQAYFQYL